MANDVVNLLCDPRPLKLLRERFDLLSQTLCLAPGFVLAVQCLYRHRAGNHQEEWTDGKKPGCRNGSFDGELLTKLITLKAK
jgi:hypothetical protein